MVTAAYGQPMGTIIDCTGVSRRVIGILPPGASMKGDRETGKTTLCIPLWKWWAQIARQHADEALAHETPVEVIDAMSARIQGEEREIPEELSERSQGNEDMFAHRWWLSPLPRWPSTRSTGLSSRY